MEQIIIDTFQQSILAQQRTLDGCVKSIGAIGAAFVRAFRAGHKVLLFGNGGSAGDAQHVAAELVGRFRMERDALPAIALTTNTSILTCLGNDYGFDQVFSRQIRALAREGDIVVGISTSGKSRNVLSALGAANEQGATSIGFTGEEKGEMASLCDICLSVPSHDTARIQECHITAWHAICDVVERELFG